MILIIIFPLSARGNDEIPEIYIDLGVMDIVAYKGAYDLLLPYWKPEGFGKILTQAHVDIIICELICDRQIIKPKRSYGSDGGRLDYGEEVPPEGNFYNINLQWRISQMPPSIEVIKKGLFFSSYRTGLNGPGYYIIPYGTREVFLTYSVLIPKYKSIEEWEINREYFYTAPQTIRWTMTWPE
jgi:hypothetical protein